METKKRRISEFFGLLKDSEQSAEEWQEIIKSIRKNVSVSSRKRHEMLDYQLKSEGK